MTRFLNWNLKAYRGLMTFYPEDLRREFGEEMLEVFEADLAVEFRSDRVWRAIRVWRIALRETIRIWLAAWRQDPALVVSGLAAVVALVWQSPLLILSIRRASQKSLLPGETTPLDTLLAVALEVAVTAVTSFVAVHDWKRASLISLRLR